MTARKKLAGVFLAGALTVSIPAVALAHHGGLHVAGYRQASGPSWMPEHVSIRCSGWSEDSAVRLNVVSYSADRVIYRCVTP